MSDSADLISISRHRWLCRSLEAEDATAWTVRHPVRKSQAYELEMHLARTVRPRLQVRNLPPFLIPRSGVKCPIAIDR